MIIARTLLRRWPPLAAALWHVADSRDRTALDVALGPRLRRAALRVLGHVQDAEDAVHDGLPRARL